MRLIGGIIFSLIILYCPRSRAGDVEKAFKYLNTGDYPKAYQNLREELSDDPKNIAGFYGLARFYSLHDNKAFNLDSAIIYINKAKAATPLKPDDKATKKYLKVGVRDYTIESLYNDLNKEAYDLAITSNTFDSYERFLKYSRDEKLNELATDKRDAIRYNEIKNATDIATIKSYLNTFPHSKKFKEANDLYERLLYKDLTKSNTYQAYKDYLDQYPTAPFASDAKRQYDLKLYEYYLVQNNLDSYLIFEKKYPNSPYLARVQDSIYRLSTRSRTQDEYNHFIKSYPNNKNIIEAWSQLLEVSTPNATEKEYQAFQSQYPSYPNQTELNQYLALSKVTLAPYKVDEKYGFVNPSTQTIVIAPQYFQAYEFSGGLAAVALRSCTDTCRYSYIDKLGKIVIEGDYSSAGDFVNSEAVVALDYCDGSPCHYGVINRRGKWVIPAAYNQLLPLSEGLYLAQRDSLYGYLNERGEEVIPCLYHDATAFSEGLAAVMQDNGWSFINAQGQKAFPNSFKNATPFSAGLAAVSLNDSTYGYINAQGQMTIPAIYEYAEPFEGDSALVTLKEKNKKSKEYGISYRYMIDKSGKVYYKLGNPNAALKRQGKKPVKQKK